MTNEPIIAMAGACGMGMAPLALYLRQLGRRVQGHDDHPSPRVSRLLRENGVELLEQPILPETTETLVRSSAVRDDHPMVHEARKRGIEVLRRGEMLARLCGSRKLIAIAGSHGKTTTSGMLAWASRVMGLRWGYVVGGLFNDAHVPPSQMGESEWLVAEVDESDGTIETFNPAVTVVPNLDWDHSDQYGSMADLEATFARLFARTSDCIFIPAGNELLDRLTTGAKAQVVRFGAGGDYEGRSVGQHGPRQRLTLNCSFPRSEGDVRAIGEFNAMNAVAALAVSTHVGGKFDPDALSGFPGIRRRQSLLFRNEELLVYQDYAHHPSEIEPLLGALRQAHPGHELVTVFQPHRYSRTRQFKKAFARVLSQSDRVYLLDVYAASEAPLAGGYASDLLLEFAQDFPVEKLEDRPALWERIGRAANAVIAFVGAGDIEDWADEYAVKLSTKTMILQANKEQVERFLERIRSIGLKEETRLRENVPLSSMTTLKVGGPARLLAEPEDLDDLLQMLKSAHAERLDVFFLGRGSNLLVADEGFNGLVIRLNGQKWRECELLDEGRLKVGAGLRLKQLSARAASLGLAGFEFLEGIPGTVGGALRMNAGAMGGWMFDVVESVQLVTPQGEVLEMPRKDFHASYRECRELLDTLAIGAVVKAPAQAETDEIRLKMDTYADHRKGSQPREPSAGCIFKNPDGDHAGRLVDVCGLKGTRIGDAEISATHGNFIINRGDATAADVLALIRHAREVVLEKTGKLLQPEVLLIGKKWEDVL